MAVLAVSLLGIIVSLLRVSLAVRPGIMGHILNTIVEKPELCDKVIGQIPESHAKARTRLRTLCETVAPQNTIEEDCNFCQEIVGIVEGLVHEEKIGNFSGKEFVLSMLEDMCIEDAEPRYRGDVYCPKRIRNQGGAALDALKMLNGSASHHYICQNLNMCFDDHKPSNEFYTSESIIPAVVKDKPGADETKSTFTIVQLTDLHLNADYRENASTSCRMPICCFPYYNGTGRASKYGEYNCNIPERTFEVFLDKINQLNPQPAFLVYTGDHPPQTSFNETYESQLAVSERLYQLLKRKMPNATVYPAIGNHETFPTAIYFMGINETVSMTRKFGEWWKDFAHFGPEQLKTWNTGGFYSVPTRKPNLRILGFNSVYGYTGYYYNAVNRRRPEFHEQFRFMREVLQNATRDKEKVILVSHHPPNLEDTIFLWGRDYTELVQDFSDVISLQLYGHQHSDQFQIVKSRDGRTAQSVLYISPCITSNNNVNPSMRIFTLEEDTYRLVDYEQHYFDLKAVIENGNDPEIVKSYSAKEEYGLSDLSPTSWLNLAQRMEFDDELFVKYRVNWKVKHDHECDRACRLRHVCGLLTTAFDEFSYCFQLKNSTSPHVTSSPPPVGTAVHYMGSLVVLLFATTVSLL